MASHWASHLEEVYQRFHKVEFLGMDPLQYPRSFQHPLDQEVVALLASQLAYGRVEQIRKSIQALLSIFETLQISPSQAVMSLSVKRKAHVLVSQITKLKHRFNPGSDWVLLLQLLNRSFTHYGSLGAEFKSYVRTDDEHLGQALDRFLSNWENESFKMNAAPSFRFFLTRPGRGGTCKRWCMFLRWMVRKDELDLGTWAHLFSASKLIMPLDTHTARLSQKLKLTRRKALDWKTALEVTQKLKHIQPEDPVRYDFSMCRLGMVNIRC